MVTRLGVLLGLVLLVWAHPALASSCYDAQGHTICILKIGRSAKNYWEYWVTVSIDGTPRPREIYNCRDRVSISPDGTRVNFAVDGPGPRICRLYRP